MFDDQRLDAALRTGFANAAQAVDPAVGELLGQATARGRRRRAVRRAWRVGALVILAVVPFSIALVARPVAAPQYPASVGADLIGTWRTASLPAAAWQDTFERAGGSPAAARAFLGRPMAGPAREYRIILRIAERSWSVSVSADRGIAVDGWNGTYVLNGRIVVTRDTEFGCEATYAVDVADDVLRVRADADTCGETDLLHQRTIFQTGSFSRLE